MKIYTKAGDKGITRLVDGQECSKASLRVECYGAVDELNSHLGLAFSFVSRESSSKLQSQAQVLIQTQHQLFNIGSHLACAKEDTRKILPPIEKKWISFLENQIDQMELDLSPLKNFILPGGSLPSAQIHVCRTVCRRAERLCVALIEEGSTEESIQIGLIYLNRLSDFLFVLSRWINSQLGVADQIWSKQ